MKSEKVKSALIVAMADNGVIGNDNQLPWRLPADMRYFKSVTMGKPIIMGRKTFESIGRVLPGRANIIVTRNSQLSIAGAVVANGLAEAINEASQIAEREGVEEIMCIGGAQLYQEILPYTDRLYVTQVHAQVEGDAFFPRLSGDQWREVHRENYKADDGNEYDYSFVIMERL